MAWTGTDAGELGETTGMATAYRRIGKRAFDVVAAALGLLFLWPVIAIVAVLVARRLGSPVLFRQTRPGRDGVPFELIKFRTMTDARGENGELLGDAERLPPFGRWLRATSLDELPELWNVLLGDMSLVGPRPLLMEYLPLYTQDQSRRHEVRPGITGWAQIHGRNALSWDDRFRLDVCYVDSLRFGLDLKIIFATVAKVIRQEGVSEDGQVTMSKFKG